MTEDPELHLVLRKRAIESPAYYVVYLIERMRSPEMSILIRTSHLATYYSMQPPLRAITAIPLFFSTYNTTTRH